jgi:hypothetical protein
VTTKGLRPQYCPAQPNRASTNLSTQLNMVYPKLNFQLIARGNVRNTGSRAQRLRRIGGRSSGLNASSDFLRCGWLRNRLVRRSPSSDFVSRKRVGKPARGALEPLIDSWTEIVRQLYTLASEKKLLVFSIHSPVAATGSFACTFHEFWNVYLRIPCRSDAYKFRANA